jgi:hypothetical protein
MARLTLTVAVAALLLVGASAADTKSSTKDSGNGSGKASKDAQAAAKMSTAKLTPAPVCAATKDAFKSYSSCASFRAGLCETVQSDSCDMLSLFVLFFAQPPVIFAPLPPPPPIRPSVIYAAAMTGARAPVRCGRVSHACVLRGPRGWAGGRAGGPRDRDPPPVQTPEAV